MKVTYIGDAWKKSLLLGLIHRLNAARSSYSSSPGTGKKCLFGLTNSE
jgi:hypothetical protein